MSAAINQLFSTEELQRYSRQLMVQNFGIDGQTALKKAHVIIIGCGGLGHPAASYLAASGIGTISLFDADTIEASNLQRQTLYKPDDIGKYKASITAELLRQQNPYITINAYTASSDSKEFNHLIKTADVVLDCCDNFDSRYRHSESSRKHKIPLVSGAAIRWEGQLISFRYDLNSSPCYECLYPKSDTIADNCASAGIIPPVVGTIGAMQASECIKILTNIKPPSTAKTMLNCYDAINNKWQNLALNADPECPCCRIK